MLDTTLLGSVNREVLLAQIIRGYNGFLVYRQLYDEKGISIDQLSEEDPLDLLRRIPILQPAQFRDLVNESIRVTNNVVDLEISSGTNGLPKRRIITDRDEEIEIQFLSKLFQTSGIGASDSVACLDTGPLTLMVSFLPALDLCGVKEAYAFSASVDSISTITNLGKLKPNVIITIPSIIERLIDPLEKELNGFQWNLNKIIYVGESIHENTRKRLEIDLGIEVFGYYGASETSALGIECKSHNGIHLFTDQNAVEIIDPDGLAGPALVTTLHQEGLPLIRYPLGDILQAYNEACQCGLSYPRVDIVGRTDDIISVLGVKLSYDSIYRATFAGLDYEGPMIIEIRNNLSEQMKIILPECLSRYQDIIFRSLSTSEHDLAYLVSSGFIDIDLFFVEKDQFKSRKSKRILDLRSNPL